MYIPPKIPSIEIEPDQVCSIMLLTHGLQMNGQPFWAYMCIKSNMAKAFLDAQKRGDFQLEDYGTILEWGEGQNPPKDIAVRMERDFGMRHDYEKMLTKAVELFA